MTKTRLIALTSAIALFAGCELDLVRTVSTGYGTPVSGLIQYGADVYAFRTASVVEATTVAGASGHARLSASGSLYVNGAYSTYPGDISRVCGMAATPSRTVIAEERGHYTMLRVHSPDSGTWTRTFVWSDCLGFNAAEDSYDTDMFLVSSDGVRRMSQYGTELEHIAVDMPDDVYLANAGEEDGQIAVVAAFAIEEVVTSTYYSYSTFDYEVAAGELVAGEVVWGTPEVFTHEPTRFHERDGMLYVGDAYGNVFEYDVFTPSYIVYVPTYGVYTL